ncbi:MAG: hypothetical protein PHC51_13215 [bacterium]|nr:hypothetical protein [bacterium]
MRVLSVPQFGWPLIVAISVGFLAAHCFAQNAENGVKDESPPAVYQGQGASDGWSVQDWNKRADQFSNARTARKEAERLVRSRQEKLQRKSSVPTRVGATNAISTQTSSGQSPGKSPQIDYHNSKVQTLPNSSIKAPPNKIPEPTPVKVIKARPKKSVQPTATQKAKVSSDRVLKTVGVTAAGARAYKAEQERDAREYDDVVIERMVGNAIWDLAGGGTIDLAQAISEEEGAKWRKEGGSVTGLFKGGVKVAGRTGLEKLAGPYKVTKQIVEEELAAEVALAQREGRKADINNVRKNAAIRVAGELTQVTSFAEATFYDADADRQAVRAERKLQSRLLVRMKADYEYFSDLEVKFNDLLKRGAMDPHARLRIDGIARTYNHEISVTKSYVRRISSKDLVDESEVEFRFLRGVILGLPDSLVVPDAFHKPFESVYDEQLDEMLSEFDESADDAIIDAQGRIVESGRSARQRAKRASAIADYTAREAEERSKLIGSTGLSEFHQERQELLRQGIAAERARMAEDARQSEKDWNRATSTSLQRKRLEAGPSTGGVVAGFGGPAAVHPEARDPKYRGGASSNSNASGSSAVDGGGGGAIYSPPDYQAARRRIAERNRDAGMPKGPLPPQYVCDANPKECE